VVSGVRFEVQTANFANSNDAAGTRVSDTRDALNAASLKYSVGKLNLAAAVQQQKTETSATSNELTKRDSQAYTANYNFGKVRGFAVYTTDKVQNHTGLVRDTKTTELGLQLPVGKNVFWASAFDGSRDGVNSDSNISGTANTANSNADVSGYQVGVRHDLSKRTAMYAIVGQQEIKAKTPAKIESTGMAVGVRHSF
jgi:predicted porin